MYLMTQHSRFPEGVHRLLDTTNQEGGPSQYYCTDMTRSSNHQALPVSIDTYFQKCLSVHGGGGGGGAIPRFCLARSCRGGTPLVLLSGPGLVHGDGEWVPETRPGVTPQTRPGPGQVLSRWYPP